MKKTILTCGIFALALSFVSTQAQIRKSAFQAAINTFSSEVSGGPVGTYNLYFSGLNGYMVQQNNYVATSISKDSSIYSADTTIAGNNLRADSTVRAKAAAAVKAATLNLQKAKTDKTLMSNLAAANASLVKAIANLTMAQREWAGTNNQFTNIQALRAQRKTELGAFSHINVLKSNWGANLTKIENDLNIYAATLN